MANIKFLTLTLVICNIHHTLTKDSQLNGENLIHGDSTFADGENNITINDLMHTRISTKKSNSVKDLLRKLVRFTSTVSSDVIETKDEVLLHYDRERRDAYALPRGGGGARVSFRSSRVSTVRVGGGSSGTHVLNYLYYIIAAGVLVLFGVSFFVYYCCSKN